jgi:hypothetical protein
MKNAVLCVQKLHKIGYVHRNISPKVFSLTARGGPPLILHSFYHTVSQTNVEDLNDLPNNKYYFKKNF